MKLRPVVRPAQPSGAAAIAACWGALLLCLCLALLFTARSPGPDTPSAPSMVPEARAALEALPPALSLQRRTLLEHACTLVGQVSYFWGGKSAAPGWDPAWGELRQVTAPGCEDSGKRLPYGLDCSGLVSWAAANTLDAPADLAMVGDGVRAQYAGSIPIDWSQLLPGDFLCFPDLSHIGLALAAAPDGTVPVLHCSRSLGGVVITADAAGAGFALAARPGWLPSS